MFDVEAYLAKHPQSVQTLHPKMRDMLWEQRRKRMYNELNQYKETQRRVPPAQTTALGDRTGWRAPITPNGISTAAINASNQEPAISSNAVTVVPQAELTSVFNLPTPSNIYADADAELNRQHIRETLAGDPLGAKKQRYGAILDTLAYLTGTTSQRGRFEKSVGTRTTAQKGKDKERQDYIDRAIGQLILKHSPENSAELKQIMIASGITDVDDLKRAFEIFEQFKPEAAPRLASDVLGGEEFAAARPTVAAIMAENPELTLEEATKIAGIVPMPPQGPQLGADAAEAMYIAEADWANMTEVQRNVFGGNKEEFVQQRAAEIMLAEKKKPLAVGPQNKAEETIQMSQVTEMLRVARMDVSAEQADYQKATLALKLLESRIVRTGPTAPTRMTIKRFIFDMFSGSDDENQQTLLAGLELGAYDFVDVVSKLFGARNISMTKGAVSDREMAIFMSMAPQLIKTQEGNIILLKIIQNASRRNLDLYNVGQEFRETHGHSSESAKLWDGYVSGHKLMEKWKPTADGFGGIIPRELWTQYEVLLEGKNASGVGDAAGYAITDNVVTSDKKGWEFLEKLGDREDPFILVAEDGTKSWWIIRNGKAIEVNLK